MNTKKIRERKKKAKKREEDREGYRWSRVRKNTKGEKEDKNKKMKNNGRINEVGYGENLGKNKSLS